MHLLLLVGSLSVWTWSRGCGPWRRACLGPGGRTLCARRPGPAAGALGQVACSGSGGWPSALPGFWLAGCPAEGRSASARWVWARVRVHALLHPVPAQPAPACLAHILQMCLDRPPHRGWGCVCPAAQSPCWAWALMAALPAAGQQGRGSWVAKGGKQSPPPPGLQSPQSLAGEPEVLGAEMGPDSGSQCWKRFSCQSPSCCCLALYPHCHCPAPVPSPCLVCCSEVTRSALGCPGALAHLGLK